MRLITRPDFDGVVCAVLLHDVLPIDPPVIWVEPGDMQKSKISVFPGDIIANLPYQPYCSLWFDHHFTNRISVPFQGMFRIAPSAARVVYDYYQEKFPRDYRQLIYQTDKIDTADLTMDEVLSPEKYPYILISMTIQAESVTDAKYYNTLISLFRSHDIESIMQHSEVVLKCRQVIEQNKIYRRLLTKHTMVKGHIAITDFRSLNPAPIGNRYLVYSLYPDTIVQLKIRHYDNNKKKTIISVGHSIFNRKCKVNVGLMLSRFEGGGHHGAGACIFDSDKSDDYLNQIIKILTENQSDT